MCGRSASAFCTLLERVLVFSGRSILLVYVLCLVSSCFSHSFIYPILRFIIGINADYMSHGCGDTPCALLRLHQTSENHREP